MCIRDSEYCLLHGAVGYEDSSPVHIYTVLNTKVRQPTPNACVQRQVVEAQHRANHFVEADNFLTPNGHQKRRGTKTRFLHQHLTLLKVTRPKTGPFCCRMVSADAIPESVRVGCCRCHFWLLQMSQSTSQPDGTVTHSCSMQCT